MAGFTLSAIGGVAERQPRMSLRDGTQPHGWLVRAPKGFLVENPAEMAIWAVHAANPTEAELIVRRTFDVAPETGLDVFSTLTADTLERLGITNGQAAGPL